MSSRVFAIALVVLTGCARDRSSTPTATTPATPTPTPTPTTPTPSPTPAPAPAANDACAEIRTRFNAELAKKTDACNADADCACYGAEGGGCGGVTDSATAGRLAPISKEFHDKSCPYLVHCAAWACAPKCQNGHCSR
jgi:hypothetical protein